MPKLIEKGSVVGQLQQPVTLPVRIITPAGAEKTLTFLEAMEFFGLSQDYVRERVSLDAGYEYSLIYIREIYKRFRPSRPVAEILLKIFNDFAQSQSPAPGHLPPDSQRLAPAGSGSGTPLPTPRLSSRGHFKPAEAGF